MSKKNTKKVIEAGFIPGIYNYCDRWCEKCSHCSQCMSYVMGKKIEKKGGFSPEKENLREDESVWARLKNIFESTYEVLHELAEERGVNVEDIYAAENINKEFWGEEFEGGLQGEKCNTLVESSDIIQICMIYESMADKCLEKIFEYLDNEQEIKRTPLPDDALEVINWYLDLIQAKMRRAMYGYHYEQFNGKTTEDYNGSAKVALIASDHSIENWQVILKHCPPYQRDISHIIVVLKQLQIDIEQQFPEARTFLRPGFEKMLPVG